MLKPCLRRLGALLLAFFVCLPAVCPAAAAEPAAAAVDVYREEEGRQLEEKAPADFSFQVPARRPLPAANRIQGPGGASLSRRRAPWKSCKTAPLSRKRRWNSRGRWENAGGQPANGRFEQDWQGNELMPTQVGGHPLATVTPSLGEDQGLNLAAGAYTLRLTMTRSRCVSAA